jgi:hypothetical protein
VAEGTALDAHIESARKLKPGVRISDIRKLFDGAYMDTIAADTLVVRLQWEKATGRSGEIWATPSPIDNETVERILIFERGANPWPRPEVVFNLIEKTKHRRCSQIKSIDKQWADPDEIDREWGPPDEIVGSGISRYMYGLEDGGAAEQPFLGPPDAKHKGLVRLWC